MAAAPVYNVSTAITKSDTVNFDRLTDAIFVGGAGIVVVVFEGGEAVNFTCVAGQILPVRAKRVNSTTTTATLMVALYQV
ncbi:hypothetical protein UFOVP1601_51 [uncultured Caudovirales phage]|uniref:Uncharacterized protein n=1 Tax=uncultured Caudovirales phage TaxID=2100421 RepID=A0A6J5STN7_9CAUD|nr:hypothetical protein UFOVP1154_5 [uncultured Caudovirales phage]CAB4200319.1 hypothetical protein UFOVP1341_32 [uncultured Caudovirales phage]CAB4218932.1 hypothetical protein UFOVP1601_51 [uncultured Caudovirales phage]